MMVENWLSIGAGAFLIGMMLYGHYRGLLKQCVSVGALILTIIAVKLTAPYVTDFIRENPAIRANAARLIIHAVGWEAPSPEESGLPAAQRISIEQMNLPQSIKDVLLENNNSEIYQLLGVEQFTEYVSSCLADMLINGVCTIVLFLIISIAIHILVRWLDLIARLPIICGLNHIAGAVLGLAQGLMLLWIAGFILNFFSATPAGRILEHQVYASTWLTFLYDYNLINLILGGLVKGIL